MHSPGKGPIGVARHRIAKQNVGIIGNTFQAITTLLNFSKKCSRILHDSSDIITIGANKLVAVTSITNPDIRISIRRGKTHIMEHFEQKVMKLLASSTKTIARFSDHQNVTFKLFNFGPSNKIDQFLGPGHKIGRSDVSHGDFKPIELPKQEGQTECPELHDG